LGVVSSKEAHPGSVDLRARGHFQIAKSNRKQNQGTNGKMPPAKGISNNVLKCTRHVNLTTITEDTIGSVYGGTYFYLGQVPGSSDFTNLFDQYRIRKVVLSFKPNQQSFTSSTGSSAVTNIPTRIVTAIDYDDSVAPTSLNELREYNTAQVNTMVESFTREIRPAVSIMAYEGVGSTGYCPKWDQWISTNDPGVPHYGIKWAVPSGVASTNGYQLAVEATFYLEFRMTK